jgi:hypothetical protein
MPSAPEGALKYRGDRPATCIHCGRQVRDDRHRYCNHCGEVFFDRTDQDDRFDDQVSGPIAVFSDGRLVGALLVVGFLVLAVGVGLYGAGDASSEVLISAGHVLTLIGLGWLATILRSAGDRGLGLLGLVAFDFATALWVVDSAIWYSGQSWVFELELGYVLLACLANAAFGAAVLRTGILPAWVGWAAIVWGVTWAVLYPPRVVLPPLGPTLIPLLFGVFLLSRWYTPPQLRAPTAAPPSTAD